MKRGAHRRCFRKVDAMSRAACAWLTVVGISFAAGCSGSSPASSPSNDAADGGSGTTNPGGSTPDGGANDSGGSSAPSGVALNALAPTLTPPAGGCTSSSEGNAYCDFLKYVAPHVNGVSVFVYWAQVDHGSVPCVEGSSDHPCDWSAYDELFSAYENAGLTVNLIVIGVNEGGTSNQGTPAYVFTPEYATSLGAPPQDMTTCALWPGAASSPVQGSKTVSGIWNHDTCVATGGSCTGSAPYTDHNGFPVVYEKPYMTGYQGFIANVLKHYSPAGSGMGPALSAKIGYARIGMTAGGENQLFCTPVWPGPTGLAASPNTFSKALFDGSISDPQSGYISAMTSFLASQKSKLPTLINAHAGPPANSDMSYADEQAAIAISNGVGFGMEALSIGDPYRDSLAQDCTDDWCNNFETNASKGAPLVLQTTIPFVQPTVAITSIAGDGSNAVVTCASDCPSYSGSSAWVQISGNSNAAFNGTFQIVEPLSSTTFAIATKTNATGTGGSMLNPDYLPSTIPFAVKKHASAFEIYLCDLFYAFDPNTVAGETCSTPPGSDSALYASTISAVSGK
jgi:hypothetical protein